MSRSRFTLEATIYDKRGVILSKGTNSYSKTHPLQQTFAKRAGREEAIYLHAEIAALVKLRNTKKKAHRIVVERYNHKGQPVNAKPCEICQLALETAGIKIIEHT